MLTSSYTHYFTGVLALVVISRHFKTNFKKTNYSPNFIKLCVKSFLNILRMYMLRIYLKKPFLLSCRSWKVLNFEFEKIFNNYLLVNSHLLIQIYFLHLLLESKAFSPSRINYLKYYFQDLFTSINVVFAMLHVMVRPNTNWKSQFLNI